MPERPEYSDWQVPPQVASESDRLGWINEITEEGQAWLKSQRGHSDYRKALDILSGRDSASSTVAAYRSKLNTNRLKRNIREVVGTLARLKPFWGYHSDNKTFKPQAEMMNKVTRALYLKYFFDLSIKDALKYAAATGRGWVHPIYQRKLAGTGRGCVTLLTYGAPCVVPVQLPSSGDFQSAYAVTILDELPVYMAHGMFPSFQHRLRPTSSRYWYSSDGIRKASQGNLMQRIFGTGPRKGSNESLANLLVPIRKTYVIDLSINTTDRPIPMGEPGASWSYTVPYVGQEIRIGTDPTSGHATFRKADENDARLYPNRRLIISSDNCVPYDGPAFDWHGMFPGASFTMDAYPWEPAGFSLIREGYEIQEAIKEIERGNMDKIRSQLNMSLAYDTNAVTSSEAKRFDPMQPSGRIGYDGTALEGTPFQPVIPPDVLKVTPESMAMIEHLTQSMDAQLALSDMMALAKMRAAPMDDIEKVVEANGPIVEDMSRSMEPPMRDIGVMIKYLVLQYMTTTEVMQYIGVDGISPQVFDYDPDSIIPSHIAGEDPDAGDSAKSRIERARIFADNLQFLILPNSLHEITQTMMKLGLVQLKKAGVKIDSQTIAEAWSLPNFGDIPGNTIIERWQAEQEMDLEFAARMMEIKAALTGGGAGDGSGANAGAPGGPPKQQEGRPPSGQAAPQLKSKDGGARSTITESK